MNESIPLSQKLYMLAIHPEKGGIISSSVSAIDYILIGGIILELYRNKNIAIENKKIVVLNTKSNNTLHRFILEKLNKSNKPLKISRWISKLHYSMKHVRVETQNQLQDRRIIRMQNKQFLFFKWRKPMLVNKQAVYKLTDEIESQIFSGKVTEDDIILLSLLKPAGLIKRIFPEREKRKQAKIKLKKMMVENQVSNAVADAIAAAQAVAASVAVSVATTSAATS